MATGYGFCVVQICVVTLCFMVLKARKLVCVGDVVFCLRLGFTLALVSYFLSFALEFCLGFMLKTGSLSSPVPPFVWVMFSGYWDCISWWHGSSLFIKTLLWVSIYCLVEDSIPRLVGLLPVENRDASFLYLQ